MPTKLKGGQRPEGELNRLVTLAYGKPGTGKSTFACTHPDPLFIFNDDRPMGHILEKLPEHYDVYYENVPLDVDTITQGMASQYLTRFDTLVKMALQAGAGTFVCDGFDILWDLVKIAKLPPKRGDEALPREYADANTWINNHLRRLGNSSLNICLTAMAKNVWTGAKTETNRMQSEGFKHRGRWITTEVYLFTPEERDVPVETPVEHPNAPLGQSHSAYIAVSKLHEEMIGGIIPGLTFSLLYRMTFGAAWPGADKLWVPA